MRSGTVRSVLGRLPGICGTVVVVEDGRQLDDGVDLIMMATGFSVALPFFSDEVLQELAFEPETLRRPLLHRSVSHPSTRLRYAAFVGLYKGPFMGVVELHAKWAARVLPDQHPRPSEAAQRAGSERFETRIIGDLEDIAATTKGKWVCLDFQCSAGKLAALSKDSELFQQLSVRNLLARRLLLALRYSLTIHQRRKMYATSTNISKVAS